MQEYEIAVTLLLESCNKLARLEFERVGALRDMKRNMAMRRNALHKIIVQVQKSSVHCTVWHQKIALCGSEIISPLTILFSVHSAKVSTSIS